MGAESMLCISYVLFQGFLLRDVFYCLPARLPVYLPSTRPVVLRVKIKRDIRQKTHSSHSFEWRCQSRVVRQKRWIWLNFYPNLDLLSLSHLSPKHHAPTNTAPCFVLAVCKRENATSVCYFEYYTERNNFTRVPKHVSISYVNNYSDTSGSLSDVVEKPTFKAV